MNDWIRHSRLRYIVNIVMTKRVADSLTLQKKNSLLMFHETKGHTGLWQHDNIFILDTLFIQNHSQKFMTLYGLILFWVGWGLCFCFSLTWHQITKYNELCQVVHAHMRVCVSFSQSHVILSSYLLSLTRLPFWLERMVAVWLPCCCHTVPRWAVIGPPLGCKRQWHVDRQVWPPAPPPPLDRESEMPGGWEHILCAMPNSPSMVVYFQALV